MQTKAQRLSIVSRSISHLSYATGRKAQLKTAGYIPDITDSLEPRDQRVTFVAIFEEAGMESVSTPLPSFFPIDRWISAVKPFQPPNDFAQFPVFGAGILNTFPVDFTIHTVEGIVELESCCFLATGTVDHLLL